MIKSIAPYFISMFALLFMTTIIGCAGQLQSTIDPNDRSFTVDIPDGWVKESDPEAALMAGSPEERSNARDVAFMGVFVEVMPVNVSLKTYSKLALEDIKENFGEFTIVDAGTTSMSDRTAMWMIITFMEQDIEIKAKVCYTVKGHKAYILCLATTPEFYPRYANLFERTIESFRIN